MIQTHHISEKFFIVMIIPFPTVSLLSWHKASPSYQKIFVNCIAHKHSLIKCSRCIISSTNLECQENNYPSECYTSERRRRYLYFVGFILYFVHTFLKIKSRWIFNHQKSSLKYGILYYQSFLLFHQRKLCLPKI